MPWYVTYLIKSAAGFSPGSSALRGFLSAAGIGALGKPRSIALTVGANNLNRMALNHIAPGLLENPRAGAAVFGGLKNVVKSFPQTVQGSDAAIMSHIKSNPQAFKAISNSLAQGRLKAGLSPITTMRGSRPNASPNLEKGYQAMMGQMLPGENGLDDFSRAVAGLNPEPVTHTQTTVL